MDATSLLQVRYVPRWHGNRDSDESFTVILRSPSRAAMAELNRDPVRLKLLRRAEAMAQLRVARATSDGAGEAEALALSAAESIPVEEMDAVIRRSIDWVRAHVIRVEGLDVPLQALEWAGLSADATPLDWILAYDDLTTELMLFLRNEGALGDDEGKASGEPSTT